MQPTAIKTAPRTEAQNDLERARRTTSLRPLPSRAHEVPARPGRRPASEQAVDDVALIARLLDGEAEAWRQFTKEYSGLIIGCIRRVLGRFSRVTSEQDVDEIYARFCCELLAHDHRKLRAFDPARGSRLSTWLGMLASNASYDYLRRIKRDRVCEPMPESDHFSSEQASPFDQASLKERAEIALSVLDELSERDQLFVQLYFGEGLEVAAVAEEMGISEKTVYTKKHKITARLEKMLAKVRAA